MGEMQGNCYYSALWPHSNKSVLKALLVTMNSVAVNSNIVTIYSKSSYKKT